MSLRIATRGSALAMAQAGQIAERLGGGELVEVSSDGGADDKARFVRGVERALLDDEARIGVHSAKDMPTSLTRGLMMASVPAREDPRDAWIGPGSSLDDVPEGARVGTSSLRRRAQLLAARPDLEVRGLSGNVDTRLRKLADGEIDAIVLATAGLKRLGRADEIAFEIALETMLPACGQGALILQIRGDDVDAVRIVDPLTDDRTLSALTGERAVISTLKATCTSPVGVHATVDERLDRVQIEAFVGLPDGSASVRDRIEGEALNPQLAGADLAGRLLGAGARDILDQAESWSG